MNVSVTAITLCTFTNAASTRLQREPHQIRLFDRHFAERLQHVVYTHQRRHIRAIKKL
jgi:hypothetical protein